MKTAKSRFLLILILFLIAFLLRAVLTPIVNKGDVLVINEWSQSLFEKGMSGSYFREGWIYSFPTQPPVMMILYWLSRWLYEHKYFLAITHNILKLPPAFVLLWIHENGPLFFVRLWGILADCLAGAVVYFLIRKLTKNAKLAFWAMFFLLFNPISIFVSSIWGQTCLVASLLALLSFLVFYRKYGKPLSPIFLTLGILIKPTVLVFLPLYLFFLVKEFFLASLKEKKSFSWLILGGFLSLAITIASFVPFWDKTEPFFKNMDSVLTRRIVPSAKGTSKVATSAFTFYTVFFDIDKTPGSYKVGFLSLDQWGNILFVLVNLTGLFLFLKKDKPALNRLANLSLVAYFIGEGTFLFKTGMAERYFLPTFFFLYILFFLTKDKRIRIAILVQFLVWFINLTSSFFLRDYPFLDIIFRQNNFLGTRIVSLGNVFIFLYLVFRFLKLKYPKGLVTFSPPPWQ